MNRKKLTTEEFIRRAKRVHGNKYDYSKTEYSHCDAKVIIICKKHGELLQRPYDHLNGCGCRECRKNIKLTTEEFIKRAEIVHGNKYDYSKSNYVNIYSNVIIICKKHGDFLQQPAHHLRGCGCRECAGNKNLTTEEFIKRAKKIHGNKYDYNKSNYINRYTKIIIICKKHGEFLQSPGVHLWGQNCPKCRKNARLTTEEFIKKAKKVHGNKYDYSKTEYDYIDTKVIIICKKHGEFLQKPNNHLSGHGCRKCALKRRSSNTKKFIQKAKKVHGNKYDYSKSKYINKYTAITIICKDHGSFTQTPGVHLQGHGCQKCGGVYKPTNEEFIKLAEKIHSNKYDYSKTVYVAKTEKIIIICKKHGEFLQRPDNHLGGHGCKNCTMGVSNMSQVWLDSLNIPDEYREKTIKLPNGKRYIVDALYNDVIYEFNGDFWHGNPNIFDPNETNPMNNKSYGELYIQTVKKKNDLMKYGYKIISIWESDFIKQVGVEQ